MKSNEKDVWYRVISVKSADCHLPKQPSSVSCHDP